MSIHLERQLEKLNNRFVKYTTFVEENFANTVQALSESNLELAKNIVKFDHKIDAMEIEIEERCLKILALYQPIAKDLRYIISVLKINNDLERVGDLSANISERVISLLGKGMEPAAFLIPQLCAQVNKMLKNSLDCVLQKNTDLAKQVILDDEKVDQMHEKMYELVGEKMRNHAERYAHLNQYISISRFLERIADHATNIAEDLIYMIEGVIIRHDKSYETHLKKIK